ncbi:hypothetical protein PCC8801_1880 [Rippkaea orientalis PCC 8801]|uniref:Abi family protein n=1 Tax=Rippkaea orientalis (strain PCC 8801 / RF-1) TaxID=41431 RepID=B7JXV8_RIPO1|nr:hypothetical protein [Rippkaea orientalis]ACK65922.1 hypothetical protein PCC8801_1880 [Rippkaea orientalis PCC 8801]
MGVVWSEEFYRNLCRSLGIPRNHPVESQIKQFLSYCHHDRLKNSYSQLSSERNQAKNKRSPLSDREQALLDPNRLWGMVKGEYNRSLREYAFLYLAFNVLEDSLRCAVDLHYTQHFQTIDWYKDRNRYPNWIIDNSKEHKLNKLENKSKSKWFTGELSFAETIAFIYDSSAWDSYQTKTLFDNKKNPENTNEILSKLSRCEVFEKLTILCWRRNAVYHHNLIRKEYKLPQGEGCNHSDTNQRDDGTFSNTRDRIYEILRYLGLKPKLVMERIIGNSETLPLIVVSL